MTAPVIYVDVDDTLVRSFGSKRTPISSSVALVRRLFDAGAELYCWSSGGAEYARTVAEELGLASCFRAFLPKPQVLVDDVQVARWTLCELHPNECAALTLEEIVAKR